MKNIKQAFTDLASRFTDLSQRERWLVLGATWGLLAWLGLLIYEASAEAKLIELEQQQVTLTTQLEQQQLMVAEFSQGIAELKMFDNASQVERLNRRLARLNTNVEQKMQTLVEPEQMSGLLLSILQQSKGLELLTLANELPTRFNSEDDAEALYRHNLSLVLRGSYLSLLDYVKQLEQLSGRIFWRSLEFELGDYPDATIQLDFFTVSRHKELLRG